LFASNTGKYEEKRKINEVKRKTSNFISLLLDAKKLMQKKRIEAKIIEVNILIEQAKRMQNGSFHASFRFEAKKFLSETGSPYIDQCLKNLPVPSISCIIVHN
jgi:hypothetical protein